MRRDDAIARTKSEAPDIRAFGVANPSLFGSVARDEAIAKSDIDTVFDPGTDAFYNLSNFMGMYFRLVDAFPGVEAGHCRRDGLSTYVRDGVERPAIRVF